MSYRERRPEYSPILKIGSGIIIADLALSGCVGRIQQAGSQETRSPQPGVTEVVPTPSPTEERITYVNGTLPDNNEISRYFGPLEGNSREITIREGDFLHRALLNYNLAPAGEARSSVVARVAQLPSGERVCVPTMPDRLYNPNIPSAEDTRFSEQDLRQANINSSEFTYKYGDPPGQVRFDAAGAVTLKNTESDLFCVNAVINDPDNPIRDPNGTPAAFGKLLTVLMDTGGEVYGTLPAVYATGQNVRITDEGYVYAGDEQVWFVGEKMAELASQLTPTPEATATPNYEELQRLKPQGVEGEVVMGENGRPQLKLGLENFETPEGLIIGEYVNSSWELRPFEVRVPGEDTREELKLGLKWFNLQEKIFDTGWGVLANRMMIQAVEVREDENTGQYELGFAFVHRGSVFRVYPDAIFLHQSRSKYEAYDQDELTMERVGKLLSAFDTVDYGTAVQRRSVSMDSFFAARSIDEKNCGFPIPGYDIHIDSLYEFCKRQNNNPDRQIRGPFDIWSLLSQYAQSPDVVRKEDGYDWFGKGLIEPFDSDEVYILLEAAFFDNVEYEWP